MNPFITRWDEPFAGKEKHVFNICLHGLNSDRAVRSLEVLSVRAVYAELRLYFTLASVAKNGIMVRFIGKRTHIFYWLV